MSKKQGNKPSKTYSAIRPAHGGAVNIKVIATQLAGEVSTGSAIIQELRKSISEAMIDASQAIVRCAELLAVDDLAHFYGEVRMAEGMMASTVGKEQSILRNIARAAFGGADNIKRLREAAQKMKLSDLGTYAKEITKKAHKNPKAHSSSKPKGKTSLTDKEFANMKRLAEFLTPAQAQRIIALCEKITKAPAAKVVALKKAA